MKIEPAAPMESVQVPDIKKLHSELKTNKSSCFFARGAYSDADVRSCATTLDKHVYSLYEHRPVVQTGSPWGLRISDMDS